METLVEHYLGNPLLLAVILFGATFVLEEAAILMAAGLAAAGEMSPALALASVAAGMVVSDWCLYALGALAIRHRGIAAWVSEERLEQGRQLLHRSTFAAGLLARLVPWLLFPIFTASGFLRVGFRRFALINLGIALVYVMAVFYGAFGLYEILLARMGHWAWLVGAVLLLAILWAGRRITRRYLSGGADN
ncbi:DedA family protein [Paracoccus sp. (in: a-proteobacteria)]|uniref:DedA family protein n=1 Tax=Paracoccus sp. TaxID=267 RepID=UPI00272C50F2|nr:VTT domain-containing protein [Paracoccus sp. (in: a-proteobacteria)]